MIRSAAADRNHSYNSDMAKTAKAPKPSSNGVNPVVLIVGGLIVVGLLTFSLSRSFRTPAAAPAAGSDPVAQTPMQSPVSSGTATPQQGSAPSIPPMASPRGPASTPAVPIAPSFDETGGATPQQLAGVARTKAVELLQKIEAKQVTVIDVRDAESYQARHIPGALHIPLPYIAGEVPYLPKDKPIVTYCTWPAEESSAGAALKLEQAGVRNVSALLGGLDEWERNGYPVERGIPNK